MQIDPDALNFRQRAWRMAIDVARKIDNLVDSAAAL
jgi:hypothetical protein